MKDNSADIERRLQNMKQFYLKANDLLDGIEGISDDTKTLLKDKILGDKDLKKLMEGIDSHRPPRIFMIGRTGVGKSSLINAICSSYVAKVSDTRSCTERAEIYQCKDGNRVLMEILDTRGIAESETINSEISAEDMLLKQINEFSPDVALFMLNCTHRDDVDADVAFLKRVANEYSKINSMRLPIVVVINKSDEMAPTTKKDPNLYPKTKIDKIQEVVQYYKSIIVGNGLKIDDIIAVSSLVEWMTPDGVEVAVEDIENLPRHDVDNLKMSFDGRYQIEELLDILEDAILDFEAQAGLRMAARLNDVVKRVANQLIKIFAGLSSIVALSPIPISDIYILLILQAVLVSLIASLSGRDISLDTAKEFIFSMGGVAGTGYALKLLAQQASKFVNIVFPGAGSAVSAGIAATGTTTIGRAAVMYYIDERDLEYTKKKFEEKKRDAN